MKKIPFYIKCSKNTSLKDMDGELWEDIIGQKGNYQVSNFSRIKSLDRYVNHWRGGTMLVKGQILSQFIRKEYLHVNITNNSLRKSRPVHQLVGEIFAHNPNNLPQINHEDGIKINNLPYNLKWGTISYNTLHAYNNGLIKKKFGENNPQSKLTDKERLEVVQFLKNKTKKYREISELYSISMGTVWDIKNKFLNV